MNETLGLFVCSIDDVKEEDILPAVVNGVPLAVYKVEGDIFITSNICTHEYAHMTDGYLENYVIECPLHGGSFDIRNGKALTAPCKRSLKTYSPIFEGNKIYISSIDEA